MEVIDSVEKSEEPIPSSGRKMWDSDDEDGLGWEHRDLIEQMKLEVRNARTGGLPTILEESETPKMMEDLKPLKIDEKFEHKDRVEEIQKVYKSYAEKMRKLDVLNYQTMHAISFLQLKDPIQLTTGQRSVSAIKSLLFPSFWPCKLRRIYADPTLKSISELHRDLELVYVGQVCLSWEILHWQYGKAKELLENDSQGYRPYNQVASEFEQFQVLVQRSVENEQFQGPRVQDYVKNRCILGALLQVPAIRDDCLKDKKENRVEGNDVVSIAMLTEIIEESMRTFWEFLRADKDEASVILKGLQGSHVHLQAPFDSELLMNIKASLQKKERRIKDILRSGNCIVKKFQKHQEGRLDHSMLLARVELRLVSRVLNMSRLTTDQLVWCQKKLNKINFVGRKIHVEPSFLLFPF
uniref:Ribosomal protein L34Ae n=2 Tax=Davidia involucrata TaxID=16924 RepID=A0A5B6Z1A4_DAVIN